MIRAARQIADLPSNGQADRRDLAVFQTLLAEHDVFGYLETMVSSGVPDAFPHRKDLGGGRFAYLMPLTFWRGRIIETQVGQEDVVRNSWAFASWREAVAALQTWNGDGSPENAAAGDR
jgi:hypothetical protein